MCTRVYVGNLPMDVRTRELDDLFYKYGRILDIDIKQPSRPPAFAFIEFDHPRDAEDAIRGRDGYEFDGQRLRVERTNGGGRRSDRGDSKGFGRNLMGSGKYSVDVTGLPESAAWQDVKDFFRKIGDVIFARVDKKGGGFIEFSNREDMLRAVSKLDDTEFKTRTDTTVIRVKEANYLAKKSGDSRSRSRSPRGRRRSHSRSRSHTRSRSRSSSRGHSRSRSQSNEKKDKKDVDDTKDDPKPEETTEAPAAAE
ncbi:hypothetical protein H310_10326 [Aphanomyces invadans]|uniref:RRM domain-containing protein n=1 Tax=Aphanomyces invadans TaxID=157072 RepID=A0A024TTH4_9STRA|nr:hypothetical protein H310_10326 [Aphanomyces invadans]ETV96632.1 hypothetical protein H310_10326 [Aphanomyces invadans]|eukprot:XP_008874895.1 hypothetical protein H310_10326 [Aphanomyces invadans]